VFLSELQPEI